MGNWKRSVRMGEYKSWAYVLCNRQTLAFAEDHSYDSHVSPFISWTTCLRSVKNFFCYLYEKKNCSDKVRMH